MSARTRTRSVLTLAAATLVALGTSTPANADAGGDVDVLNTETVQVYLDAEGDIKSQRVYEQLELKGTGEVDLRNPVATDGLRNLDGFSGFDVKDGEQVVRTTVEGEKQLRTVSDFDGRLPLKIGVAYTLDGKSVEPGDIVGRSGSLEVRFTVENVTGEERQLSVSDGEGGTVSTTAEVPIPIVGSLTTVTPATFDDVRSGQANMAGDGRGGMKLSFTMTLFPPIGSTKAEFGYTAKIKDGVVPRVDVSALPVNPLESPSFKTAAASYQGGADTGAELTAGATEIDSNLLRLRDGAAELLAGLIQLNDGAGRLADGTTQLDEGAGKLADGTTKVKDGAGDAADGSRQLTDGLKRIDGGLDQLADAKSGLPTAENGIKQLRDGIAIISAGLGDPSDPKSLIGGLKALGDGLGTAEAGTGRLAAGMDQLRGAGGLAAARAGVDDVRSGLVDATRDGGSIDSLLQGLGLISAAVCPQVPGPLPNGATCAQVVGQLIAGATQSRTNLDAAASGLLKVSSGLGAAIATLSPSGSCDPAAPTLRCGLSALAGGLSHAKAGAGDLQAGAQRAKGGIAQVDGGLRTLAAGIAEAVSGVLQLSNGADKAHAGSSDLTDGLSRLADGAGELNDGAGKLADGTGELDAGARKLADGTDQAVDGAPRLRDGAQRLSDEGTSKLVDAGASTTQNYGQMVAVLNAGAERAQSENMAYGAPKGSTGLTAYTYVIEGDDGEGGRNLARGLTGVLLLGAGAGVLALRRRLG
ncbi:hypothetical protein FHP29_05965 [Nocardioides albidus]|uniref:YhgE/Pip domain-containing protein n=1 Tax=Nocardioides albidus TaxID=1517589 RepID=A0A5C4W585_9ACTN|nr:hypothetical protein [Nocardioides albidus]TNM43243.1 hypothetical protein FHP29_05965 [Nocardioides albidus]